jgi:hypothetical protein
MAAMETGMDRKALLVATVTGTIAQVLLVVSGHFVPWIADNLFALGGVALSVAAGVIYARRTAEAGVLVGGALAGGLCAVIGIAVSTLLGDVPWTLLAVGGLASAIGGAGGAAVQRVVSRRAAGRTSAKP